MKKILYILLIIVFGESCFSKSSPNIYEDDAFENLMYEYYNFCLRYPRSTNDYLKMFYTHDSLNNFSFVRSVSFSPKVKFKFCKDYIDFIDSVYSSDAYAGGVAYMLWKAYYINQSDDDMEYKNGKLYFHNNDDKNIYYAKDFKYIVNEWLSKNTSLSNFSYWKRKQVLDYINIKMCTKDSIVIEYPDSVFNKNRIYDKLVTIIDDSIGKYNPEMSPKDGYILCGIRYYRNGTLRPADESSKFPQGIMNNKRLIEIMDSCLNIDERIDFMQFYYVKQFKKKKA